MFLSYEWLSEFLDLSKIDARQLADKMSRSGIEIEGVENFGENLTNLVVGEVIECIDHPNSDHLHVTKVNVGSEELLQIVCGAPNVHKGAKVIVAMVGATLPGDFKIKKSKLRGEVSEGMLCALQELGFKESVIPKKYAEGLFILPEDAPIGADIIDYLKLNDPILELSITPNRADALSTRGAAYEVAAVIDQKPKMKVVDTQSIPVTKELNDVTIEVTDNQLSSHYQLRLIKDVQVKESPIWLQMRLMKAGIRPLNNVVDLTNYFLLEYGQPMHAFDFDSLKSKAIKVDYASEGQVFKTLDGNERVLSNTDIVIKAGEEPVALAGVMGGLDSEVTEVTCNVLLETAVFDRLSVRKTASKFNLRSESSARFEKGINVSTINEAGQHAAELIAELATGTVEPGVVEHKDIVIQNKEISLKFSAIKRRLGINISTEELEAIFERLNFDLMIDQEEFTVSIPPRRWDIEIEADVLEEIARIYGYDNIPTTLPTVPSTPGKLSPKQKLVRQTRTLSENLGLNQVISYVLTSPKEAELIRSDEAFVKLALPMSEERSVLRQSLFPALIEIARYNQARQNKNLAFYEIGKVFFSQGETSQPREEERFAILVSGQYKAKSWFDKTQMYDFFTLKGMLENYFSAIRIDQAMTYQATNQYDVMHPGRTANILLNG